MSTPTTTRYCIDCRHFVAGNGAPFTNQPLCNRFTRLETTPIDPVWGDLTPKKLHPVYCSAARAADGLCGPAGVFFEAGEDFFNRCLPARGPVFEGIRAV